MERRQFHLGIGIGAAIGALLAVVLFCYLLAFEPGGFRVAIGAGVGIIMIGMLLGAIFGWVFSRSRPTAVEVIGVPQGRNIRILMWLTTAWAIFFAVRAGRGGEIVEALGWLGLAGAWILGASGVAQRARIFLYLSGAALLLGLLLLSSGFILGEF
jgi:hypothetical protein